MNLSNLETSFMIEIIQRRLNPRYYAGDGIGTTGWRFNYEVSVAVTNKIRPELTAWIQKVEASTRAFRSVMCEGKLEAYVNASVGFGTQGRLCVFDDKSLEHIKPLVPEFFEVLNQWPHTITQLHAYFIAKLEVKAIRLAAEGGISVPFEELDTEPVGRPTKLTPVDIMPRIMRN